MITFTIISFITLCYSVMVQLCRAIKKSIKKTPNKEYQKFEKELYNILESHQVSIKEITR